ncbi:MAG: hypothetical protein ACREHD_35060 [Pirellulales bacterium]
MRSLGVVQLGQRLGQRLGRRVGSASDLAWWPVAWHGGQRLGMVAAGLMASGSARPARLDPDGQRLA